MANISCRAYKSKKYNLTNERNLIMNIQLTIDAVDEIDISKLSKKQLEKHCLRLKVLLKKVMADRKSLGA